MTASTATLLAEALQLPPSEITEETGLETCAGWDSMAHFRVVAAIEEALDRPLSPSEIFEITGYASVEALLTSG